jgi:hypothetical protein
MCLLFPVLQHVIYVPAKSLDVKQLTICKHIIGVEQLEIETHIIVCPFSFGHSVVYPSLISGFSLPLWYLQTLLIA